MDSQVNRWANRQLSKQAFIEKKSFLSISIDKASITNHTKINEIRKIDILAPLLLTSDHQGTMVTLIPLSLTTYTKNRGYPLCIEALINVFSFISTFIYSFSRLIARTFIS